MANNSRDWFIRERSEALASLVLTSREDVKVRLENNADSGVDLVVEIKDDKNPLSTKVFFVQVRGTTSSDKSEWMESVQSLFKAGPFYLPVCLFVINVRDNHAEYAWLAEPQVDGKNAKLNFFEQGVFYTLDKKAVDQIIDSVEAWYAAMPRGFLAPAT